MTVEHSLFYRGTPWLWNTVLQGHTITVEQSVYFTGAHHDCGTVFIGAHHDCGTLFILQGHTITVEQSIYFTGACCDCNNLFYRGTPWLWSNARFTGACHDCGAMFILQGHAMIVERYPRWKPCPQADSWSQWKFVYHDQFSHLCFEIFQRAPDEGADLTLSQSVTFSADDHLLGKCSYCKTQVELPGAPVCTSICRWFWEKSFSVIYCHGVTVWI